MPAEEEGGERASGEGGAAAAAEHETDRATRRHCATAEHTEAMGALAKVPNGFSGGLEFDLAQLCPKGRVRSNSLLQTLIMACLKGTVRYYCTCRRNTFIYIMIN